MSRISFIRFLPVPAIAECESVLGVVPQAFKASDLALKDLHLHLHLYTFSAGVVGPPQMTSQPVSSAFLCSPLPSGTWRTPGRSIPWWCFHTSFSVCLVFSLSCPPLLSLCLARLFRPDLINGRHVHTTSVCVSLHDSQEVFVWSECLLDFGTDFLVGNVVFVWDM